MHGCISHRYRGCRTQKEMDVTMGMLVISLQCLRVGVFCGITKGSVCVVFIFSLNVCDISLFSIVLWHFL